MENLQNNFTTIEQSKLLLELGVPADSADCFYEAIGFGGGYRQFPIICDSFNKENRIDLPCWSVGRLIEIYSKCNTISSSFYTVVIGEDSGGMVEQLIIDFETLCKHKKNDFSKLEE